MTYTFARENGKVTNAIKAQGVQTDAVNSIKVQGVDAKLTGGKGTQADPYTYVPRSLPSRRLTPLWTCCPWSPRPPLLT